MMQALGRRYVRAFNARHGRTGTLWEGRYKSCLVDSDRYLLGSPVFQSMVEKALNRPVDVRPHGRPRRDSSANGL